MRQLEQFVGEKEINPLSIYVYPGPERSYTLYQDDKVSMDFETKGAYRTSTISTKNGNGSKQVIIKRTHDQYTPAEPYFIVQLLGNLVAPAKVELNGSILESFNNLESSQGSGWYYDTVNTKLVSKIMDDADELVLSVTYPQ